MFGTILGKIQMDDNAIVDQAINFRYFSAVLGSYIFYFHQILQRLYYIVSSLVAGDFHAIFSLLTDRDKISDGLS